MAGPDFVIVGAARCGTTWLHGVLARHPQIWVPPLKELHYFDSPRSKYYRKHLYRRLQSMASWRRPPSRWDLRYFLGKRSDQWYGTLFTAASRRGFITGEATPAYATLDEPVLKRLRAVNPSMRIIYLMRDPVERTWSSLRKGQRSEVVRDWSVEEILERANASSTRRRSDYLGAMARLESAFGRVQVHYEFHDDIRDRPVQVVERVLAHVGADPGPAATLLPPGRVNAASARAELPGAAERDLMIRFGPAVDTLAERFGGPPERWRQRYVETVGMGGAGSVDESFGAQGAGDTDQGTQKADR